MKTEYFLLLLTQISGLSIHRSALQTGKLHKLGNARIFSSVNVFPKWDLESDDTMSLIASEIKQWLAEHDVNGSFLHIPISSQIAKFVVGQKREFYRYLFKPKSQTMGEQLYDHLAIFYAKKEMIVLNKAAFDSVYVNPGGRLIKRFSNHIEYCFKKCERPSEINAPYFVLCQSSGYGKSRLIKQLATDSSSPYKWLYLCLRKQGRSGYPVTSESLLNDLTTMVTAGKTASSAILFFQAWTEYLCRQSVFPSWSEMELYTENAELFFQKSFMDASGLYEPIDLDNSRSLAPLPPLIVVLDEASYLLDQTVRDEKGVGMSLFRTLRRGLSGVSSQGRRIMFILVDSLSHVSDFSPPGIFSRYRVVDEGEINYRNLLPPFYKLSTADSLVDYQQLKYDSPMQYFLLGRPLWAATTKNGKINIQDLLSLARRKLFGEHAESEQSSVAARVVPFAVCANFYVSPEDGLSGELVASHMATLIGMSESRRSFVCTYPSEPILAEVALSHIGCMSIHEWHRAVNDLSRLMLPGSRGGDRGEFVGLVLLLLARFRAHKEQRNFYVSDEVPLTSFLESLLGESARNITGDLQSSELDAGAQQSNGYDEFLSHSFVSATHFTTCTRGDSIFKGLGLPSDILKSLYASRTALLLPSDWKGADALIPVRTVDTSSSSSHYSVILIQFHNREKDAEYPDSATKKLSSNYVFDNKASVDDVWKEVPCIRLYMQLGSNVPQPAIHPHIHASDGVEGTKYYALAAFGLTAEVYPCLRLRGIQVEGEKETIVGDLSSYLFGFMRQARIMSPMPYTALSKWGKWDDDVCNGEVNMRDLRKIHGEFE